MEVVVAFVQFILNLASRNMRSNQAECEEQTKEPEMAPVKKNRQSATKFFSHGFPQRLSERLEKHNSLVKTKFDWDGRSARCELDHSQLNKEAALELAMNMFELYYTDKTVKRLVFEKNVAKMVAGYSNK